MLRAVGASPSASRGIAAFNCHWGFVGGGRVIGLSRGTPETHPRQRRRWLDGRDAVTAVHRTVRHESLILIDVRRNPPVVGGDGLFDDVIPAFPDLQNLIVLDE